MVSRLVRRVSARRERTSGLLRPLTTVAILEPHHVVELGRAHLEQDGVLGRLETVPRPWCQVVGLARCQDPVFTAAVDLVPGLHPSGVQVEWLLLALVILQAEGLAGAHPQHLAGVAAGMREDNLLAPRLRDPAYGAHSFSRS